MAFPIQFLSMTTGLGDCKDLKTQSMRALGACFFKKNVAKLENVMGQLWPAVALCVSEISMEISA